MFKALCYVMDEQLLRTRLDVRKLIVRIEIMIVFSHSGFMQSFIAKNHSWTRNPCSAPGDPSQKIICKQWEMRESPVVRISCFQSYGINSPNDG